MSQENIEVVRRINETFNRRDLAAMLDLMDSDAEWWTPTYAWDGD
jgi:ketosteroid isomerase-like protein